MASKKVIQLINDQITQELQAAHNYKAMEVFYINKGLTGFAHWMHVQSEEEIEHAYRFINYLDSIDEPATIGALTAPQIKFDSLRAVFEASLKQEQQVTKLIDAIYTAAVEDKDYATKNMLEWFISEQVEEEDSVRTVLNQFDIVGDDKLAIYTLNKELGARKE